MKMTYGIEILENNDPFVTLIEDANRNFNIASTPGTFQVFSFSSVIHEPWSQANFWWTSSPLFVSCQSGSLAVGSRL